MTTAVRKEATYTVIGRNAPGGLTTSDAGGAQVVDDSGDIVLQDPNGGTIVVSAEEYANNWTVVTP